MCSFPIDITYGTLPWGSETLTVLYPKNKEPYVCITELNRKVRMCTICVAGVHRDASMQLCSLSSNNIFLIICTIKVCWHGNTLVFQSNGDGCKAL